MTWLSFAWLLLAGICSHLEGATRPASSRADDHGRRASDPIFCIGETPEGGADFAAEPKYPHAWTPGCEDVAVAIPAVADRPAFSSDHEQARDRRALQNRPIRGPPAAGL